MKLLPNLKTYKWISAPHSDNTVKVSSAVLIKSSLLFITCPIMYDDILQLAMITLKINRMPIYIVGTYAILLMHLKLL